jgi:hypothetical protein
MNYGVILESQDCSVNIGSGSRLDDGDSILTLVARDVFFHHHGQSCSGGHVVTGASFVEGKVARA